MVFTRGRWRSKHLVDAGARISSLYLLCPVPGTVRASSLPCLPLVCPFNDTQSEPFKARPSSCHSAGESLQGRRTAPDLPRGLHDGGWLDLSVSFRAHSVPPASQPAKLTSLCWLYSCCFPLRMRFPHASHHSGLGAEAFQTEAVLWASACLPAHDCVTLQNALIFHFFSFLVYLR